ncbi:MAG: hypothetical protein ACRDZ3_07350 [Acidimicrobiia bacterium]
MTTRWKPILMILAAVVLVAAGCGNDGGSGEVRNLGAEGATSSSAAGGASTSSTGGSGAATTSSTGGGSPAACEVQGGVSTEGKQEVMVALNEWKVLPEPTQVAGGITTFVAENTGVELHELVIAKGDDPAALPKDDQGAMDEEQLPEGALIGEIEGFPAGQVCEGNFTLQSGKYVLFCNIVETEADGTSEAHYAEGMYTAFTVS